MLQAPEATLTGKKLSKWRRSEQPLPHVLTDRDRAIIAAVAEYRILSREQIQRLFGIGTATRANFRLGKLFHNGYLQRQAVPVLHGSSQALYTLDRFGVPVAAERLGKDPASFWCPARKFSPLFLTHQLAVNDVRIALELAARTHADRELMLWSSEYEAKDRFFFGLEWLTLTPDAFLRFRVGHKVLNAFLEVDLSSMPLRRFKEKVERYVAYDASGRFNERHKSRHFRVLVVAKNQARLANLKRAIAGWTSRVFWLAILSEIKSNGVLSQIWQLTDREEPHPLLLVTPHEARGQ